MLGVLTRAIEERDPYTRGHSSRVTAFAETLAIRLGWDEPRLTALRVGGLLHDIGKLAVSQHILRKPGRLSPDELVQVRAHPAVGARLIEPMRGARPALPYVLYHHERWDGTGYPTGLAGARIPLEGRVLAVADAFDAMTSMRPYRRALTAGEALEEVERCAGSQFDPDVARVFLEAWGAGALEVAAAAAL